jgi:hypothetical protein
VDGGSIGATLVRETGRALSRGAARLATTWSRLHGVTAIRAQDLRLRPARIVIHPVIHRMLDRAGVDLDLYVHEWLTNDAFSGSLWPHPEDVPAFSIRMWNGELVTTLRIGEGITLDMQDRGREVITLCGIDLPDSVIDLLPGRPLEDLIDAPSTRGLGLTVDHVERWGLPSTTLRICLRPLPWVRVGSPRRGALIASRRPPRRRMVYDMAFGGG